MMGEVRVKVKLTNALDRALARRGQIENESIRSYEADALIDTGAVSSVIPLNVMEQLGLQVDGQRVAEYADGRNEIVDLTEPITFEIIGRKTTEGAMVLGDEVLIGQTVLEVLDLLVDCHSRKVIPNPAHPDQPVVKIK
ncbi:MAG: aspartyl protease family protein [Pyrinomonadaceae bacterium]|jgi:clan AA aspartic protease|nr:clan AA aspartic protease [Blastocatellia bacterium]MDQ3221460.1 clan AA aspartic protease [Acidobacteriota bacterium]MDQ3489708.1 clan AA aspartic protease [Acidobacteriota bacterium]